MKNVLLSLAVSVLLVMVGHAQEELKTTFEFQSGSVTTFFNKETVEYKFKSQDDLKATLEEIIRGVGLCVSDNKKEPCEVSIELKLEIRQGGDIILVSQKMTSSFTVKNIDLIAEHLKILIQAATG